MNDEAEEELRELLGRAALAQEETGRLLAELARKQKELAEIQKRLADAASRSAGTLKRSRQSD